MINMPRMKALTLWQPWASLVDEGFKEVETRSWSTDYRGWLAIHAAKKTPKYALRSAWLEPFYSALRKRGLSPYALPSGLIVMICELTDCQRIATKEQLLSLSDLEIHFGDYTTGRFMWSLTNFQRLSEYIPATGKQGLWDWDPKQAG